LISLYEVTPSQIADVRMKDISIEVLGHSQHALSLGSLKGNLFDITIRDVSVDDLTARVQAVTETAVQGLPNYYGVQRFGVVRPITHRIGQYILKGDYEKAVMSYIGEAFPDEPDEIRTVRKSFSESEDAIEALHRFPVRMSFERSMLHHLVTDPGDYGGALQVLPPKLLSMFVSAFQSYLFNCALSARFDDDIPLAEPVAGDRLIFTNGREDRVTEQNRTVAIQHISRGRCSVAIYMPGTLEGSEGYPGPVIDRLLQELGIGASNFSQAQAFVHTRFNGALRSVTLTTGIESVISENSIRLKFSLPPGHYATTVCREYMKTDPLSMI
jgi:tRNA pseudouridine13 synthase